MGLHDVISGSNCMSWPMGRIWNEARSRLGKACLQHNADGLGHGKGLDIVAAPFKHSLPSPRRSPVHGKLDTHVADFQTHTVHQGKAPEIIEETTIFNLIAPSKSPIFQPPRPLSQT